MKPEAKAVIEELRSCIPSLDCFPGCTACCSHVPWSEAEWSMLPEAFKERHTIHSLKCPFIDDRGCSCHGHRPIVCRLFGVAEGMDCPRGVPAFTKLTFKEASDISRRYAELF